MITFIRHAASQQTQLDNLHHNQTTQQADKHIPERYPRTLYFLV